MLGLLAQDFDRGTARMGQDVADDVLVARAQKGDKNAFGLLVRKYQYRVTKLVSRFVSDSEAVDVAQESFIKAWRALGGFKGNSAFYTWLYRISINTAKNHLVARGRRPANQDIDVADAELYGHTERLSHSDTPEAILLGDEVQSTVLNAIQDLPSDLRTAILLREIEGMSYEEIAEAMDCPIGTVRSRIFRARTAIEETLRPLSN
jgi:RNA polymerase sigma-70 factor, ECF subfamily